MNKLICILIFSSQIAEAALPILEAKGVMAKNEQARQLSDVKADTKLTNIDKGGSENVKKFTWWRKLAPNKVNFNTLTRFQSPAEIRDEAVLFLEKENGKSEVLLYLPAFKKTRRVENQAQSQSFMGSQFSYSDISTPDLNSFDYKLLPESTCHDGGVCYVVESTPKTVEVKERFGYSKQIQQIRSDNFMVSQVEYFNLEGQKLKKLMAYENKEVDSQNSKWMAHRLEVENFLNSKKTKIEFSNVKVNQGISDALFAPQNISRK
ncbi:MAG: outer membrane lipoprotein-sorting protein [Bdellovibrionales bacterium]